MVPTQFMVLRQFLAVSRGEGCTCSKGDSKIIARTENFTPVVLCALVAKAQL